MSAADSELAEFVTGIDHSEPQAKKAAVFL